MDMNLKHFLKKKQINSAQDCFKKHLISVLLLQQQPNEKIKLTSHQKKKKIQVDFSIATFLQFLQPGKKIKLLFYLFINLFCLEVLLATDFLRTKLIAFLLKALATWSVHLEGYEIIVIRHPVEKKD